MISRHGHDLPCNAPTPVSRNLVLDEVGLWLFLVVVLPARQSGRDIAGQQLLFAQQPGILEGLEIRQVAHLSSPNSSKNSLVVT